MFWNACMWAQRSAVLMQGSSLLGLSFARALHALDDGSADAPGGAIRPTARQARTSHDLASRDLRRYGMRTSPSKRCDRSECVPGRTDREQTTRSHHSSTTRTLVGHGSAHGESAVTANLPVA